MAYTKYPHPTTISYHGGADPAIAQLDGSAIEWIDDIVTDRTVSGVAKSRALYAAKRRNFRLIHSIEQSGLAAYEAFYDAWRAGTTPFTTKMAPFLFTWSGNMAEYTVRFAGAPRLSWTGTRIQIEAALLQV